MPRFAANLSLMFREVEFLDRFEAAARAGFRAVEFQFPYAFPAPEIARRLRDLDLELATFNLPCGDWEAGERGLAVDPGRRGEFRAALGLGLRYAERLGAQRLHVLCGVSKAEFSRSAALQTACTNLREACSSAQSQGVDLMLEPLNARDHPGYLLTRCADAADLVAAVGATNLRLQFDIFHVQTSEGDIAMRLEEHFALIGHVQVAGVPGRHEPDEGELNYPWLFRLLDAWGYRGLVGCEYRPRGTTQEGLAWLAPYRA